MLKNNSLQTSFDYTINDLILYSSDGNYIDLSGIMTSIDIYENVFVNCMTGSVTVSDGNDLLSKFKWHGNEFIEMNIDKPTLELPIKKVFRVYKIANRKIESGNQSYDIFFCSEELILSSQMKISKSYKGLTTSQIIEDIMKNILQTNPKKMLDDLFEKTEIPYDIIIPNMMPLEAINWLLTRSYAQNKSLFFFYENRDGYNLQSYESLIKKPVYTTFTNGVKLNNQPNDNINSFTFFKVVDDFDILKAAKFGSYSSKFLYLDIISKQFNVSNYSAFDFKSKGILNKELMMNSAKNRFDKDMYTSFDNMIKYSIGNDFDQSRNPFLADQWLPQTISKIGQLQLFKAVGTVAGDPLLKAGMIVNLDLTEINPQTAQNVDINSIRSGKYMITSLHHSFHNPSNIHTTTMQFASDSINDYLYAPSNSPKLRELKKA